MENKAVYKVKSQAKESEFRGERLTVRLSAEDRQALDRICALLSPYAPLSLGKALSVSIKLTEKQLAADAALIAAGLKSAPRPRS